MKDNPKVEDNFPWDRSLRNHFTVSWTFPKFVLSSLLLISILCIFYIVSFSNASNKEPNIIEAVHVNGGEKSLSMAPPHVSSPKPNSSQKTSLHHIVFGIAASARLWDRRKNYIKLWWKPQQMRGVVWLDKGVRNGTDDHLLPPRMVSGDTSQFRYNNPRGHRSAIRISRIVSETLRLG
ncbi:hypothetical protein V6N13_045559 [Hibiscus sabdariffa]|uniref:Uncharacterized protein n=1 Tax=Hibiscus sabdariffa TaxID=183260 RepID=A0ABR2RLF3_9ROSI